MTTFGGLVLTRYSADQSRASDGRFGEGEGHSGYAVERIGPHHVVMSPEGRYAGAIKDTGRGPYSHTPDYTVRPHVSTQEAVNHLIATHQAQEHMHTALGSMHAAVAAMNQTLHRPTGGV